MSNNSPPKSSEFLAKAVKTRLLEGMEEADKLLDLSDGLEWLKDIIDGERERQVASKLLTFKLLYAGYFGNNGRSTKFANNPCAVREALKFCRDNKIAPPDWAMKYVYELMSGKAQPPTPQDEKRWQNLMKLLDLAQEWDRKAQAGMDEKAIENYFKKKGVGENPLRYVKAFVNPQNKRVVFDFAKSLTSNASLKMDMDFRAEADFSNDMADDIDVSSIDTRDMQKRDAQKIAG